jgi:hypothetical protein
MGDRANVQFQFARGGRVNLYAHWAGTDLAVACQKALGSDVAKARYGDGSYLCRIVIQQVLTENAPLDDPTGFGISTEPDDNEHRIVVVHVDGDLVEIDSLRYTFAEFCAIPPAALRHLVD